MLKLRFLEKELLRLSLKYEASTIIGRIQRCKDEAWIGGANKNIDSIISKLSVL